jgi:hypothetical protein
MQFIKQSPLTLKIFSKKMIDHKTRTITTYQFTSQKSMKCFSEQTYWRKEDFGGFLTDKYAGYIDDENNTLWIIKKKCAPLYICKQAIKNNTNLDTLDNILKSQQYQQLTGYEKSLINQEITQEKSWSRNNPMLLALQRK